MLKIRRSILSAILLGLLISSCGIAAQPAATQLAESMKGYELYSWQGRTVKRPWTKSNLLTQSWLTWMRYNSRLKKSHPGNTLHGHQKKRCPSRLMTSSGRSSKSAKTPV